MSGILLTLAATEPAPAEFLTDLTLDELLVETSAAYRTTIVDSTGRTRDIVLRLAAGDGTLAGEIMIRAEESDGSDGSTPGEWVKGGEILVNYNLVAGKFTGTSGFTLNITGFAGGATGQLTLDLSGMRFQEQSILTPRNYNNIELTGIETQLQARSAMSILTQRQQDVAVTIGNIGAVQSRLQTAMNVLSSQKENVQAASSRIVDADIAQETATLVSAQIRQQAAAKVLMLANRKSELALSLLS